MNSLHQFRVSSAVFRGLLLLPNMLLVVAGRGLAQSSPETFWTGHAQCQVAVQTGGYTHQETQTWAIPGGTPKIQGAMQIYSGTWSVTGQGTTMRALAAQTLAAQWNSNVPPMPAPIAVFVRASDNRLIIKPWHAQLHAAGALTGTRQLNAAGVSPVQSAIGADVYEWEFPTVEDAPTSASLSGSGTIPIASTFLPISTPGVNGTANCTWQFSKGASDRPISAKAAGPLAGRASGAMAGGASAGASGSTTADASGTDGGANPSGAQAAGLMRQMTPAVATLKTAPAPASSGTGQAPPPVDNPPPPPSSESSNSSSSTTESGACPANQSSCSSTCVDLTSDINNCGTCGNQCTAGPANTSVHCSDSQCTFPACNVGYADCNGSTADGCETKFVASNASCACNIPHQNGLGQVYADCKPPAQPGNAATYNQMMAYEAAAAFTGNAATLEDTSCHQAAHPAHPAIDVPAVLAISNGSCVVWVYGGQTAGFVHTAPGNSDASCYCPTTNDNSWN